MELSCNDIQHGPSWVHTSFKTWSLTTSVGPRPGHAHHILKKQLYTNRCRYIYIYTHYIYKDSPQISPSLNYSLCSLRPPHTAVYVKDIPDNAKLATSQKYANIRNTHWAAPEVPQTPLLSDKKRRLRPMPWALLSYLGPGLGPRRWSDEGAAREAPKMSSGELIWSTFEMGVGTPCAQDCGSRFEGFISYLFTLLTDGGCKYLRNSRQLKADQVQESLMRSDPNQEPPPKCQRMHHRTWMAPIADFDICKCRNVQFEKSIGKPPRGPLEASRTLATVCKI